MYTIIKNVITLGNYVLSDMTQKINTLWITGELTDEQHDELIQLMYQNLNPSTEAPELSERLSRVENRVTTLEEAVKELQQSGGETPEPEPGTVVIPEWEPWDGVSDKYQYGAVVQHNSKYYLDTLQNMQNTWEPGTFGVDEHIWKEITKEEAEALLAEQESPEEEEPEQTE